MYIHIHTLAELLAGITNRDNQQFIPKVIKSETLGSIR